MRFVFEDRNRDANTGEYRPYAQSDDGKSAPRMARGLVGRTRRCESNVDYRWNGNAATLELVEIAAVPGS